ncbi:hypothetical protein NG726_33950, partial [Pseudomonas sp. MOB-449]|nr:hypothetical protein [Pseudomonas sp. MOB-449]
PPLCHTGCQKDLSKEQWDQIISTLPAARREIGFYYCLWIINVNLWMINVSMYITKILTILIYIFSILNI